MQEGKMQINAEVWKQALEEIETLSTNTSQLEEENTQLRHQLLSLQHINHLKGRHSLTQNHNELTPTENHNKAALFKTQMTQWANSLQSKHFSKLQESNQVKEQVPEEISKTFINKIQSKEDLQEKSKKRKESLKEMGLIEAICLFGPDEKRVEQQIINRRMEVNNSLIYCSHEKKENFEVYGSYFYSEGQVACKNLKESEAATQINQMIFRKNTKKEDCNLFLFRGDETNEILKLENQVISKINPGRWLCAFFVQFSDFQYINIDGVAPLNINNSEFQHQETKFEETKFEQTTFQNENREMKGNENDKSPGEERKFTNFIKSKYTLCIFTYFPFVNVMEQLLSCLLDETKIKRVERYSDVNSMEAVTIKFLVEELKGIGSETDAQLVRAPVTLGEIVEIKFGNFSMNFEINESKLDELLFSGWVYDILKIFEKDLIYDIYTNLMTEESICFVSENMHLLSYVIFLFVCVLPFPFTYPHPCISQVFNFELLESPFVVTAGINQSIKWVEECVGNYPKKIFIDLNDDECKVKGKKKLKPVKSERLKRIFNTLYKKIESTISPVPQLFKKKTNIIRPASKEENESAIQFIRALQTFYSEEIFFHLPNPAIITFIRDKTEEKNETSKIFNLLKEIEKYLKESRKQKEKDQFVDLLIQQQIFYVHMGMRYSLD